MKITAFVPIKLNSERFPNKNIRMLGKKPLCSYIFETLLKMENIDDIYCYCSDESVKQYLPHGIDFLKRPKYLDGSEIKIMEVIQRFLQDKHADIYLFAHCTAPFVQSKTIQKALDKVISGKYDSAFAAKVERTFAWYQNKAINYSPDDIPRTQDIEPFFIEASSFYIFKKDVADIYKRSIGYKPYIQEVKNIEAIDIDYKEDFEFAEIIAKHI